MNTPYYFVIDDFTTLDEPGPFAPSADFEGTSAIAADSNIFVAWATGATLERGYQDITDPGLGLASAGDSSLALDVAGVNGVVSLGDGGVAILTFDQTIFNGEGWDFAVFENSFSDTYLELAFVEVSSDGVNFYRFPASSHTPYSVQVDGFGSIDATRIDNFAGKYRALFGTPFDLEQLAGEPGLNVNAISHMRIIDVVGSIDPLYATYDQYGNIVNDPWNTPFPSSGFDLDAVGVIHVTPSVIEDDINESLPFIVYPQPASGELIIDAAGLEVTGIYFYTMTGILVHLETVDHFTSKVRINTSAFSPGNYIMAVETVDRILSQNVIIGHE